MVTVILVSRAVYYFHGGENAYLLTFWNSFFRADSFLTGFILYMLIQNGAGPFLKKYMYLILFTAAAVLIIGIYFNHSMGFGAFFPAGGFTAIAIFYAAALLFVIFPGNNWIKKISAAKFLRYTGNISYGLYLFHLPVFLACKAAAQHLFSTGPGDIYFTAAVALVSSLITYTVCTISFRYFESYFLKWKLSRRNSVN